MTMEYESELNRSFGLLSAGSSSRSSKSTHPSIERAEKVHRNPRQNARFLHAIEDSSFWQDLPRWDTLRIRAPFRLFDVAYHTGEFQRINEQFTSTFRDHTIVGMQRIENPFLMAQYLLKKEKMDDPVEKLLFHGTRQRNIESIATYNFNWRLRGTAKGHKFGQGVSFSPNAYYAHHFSKGEPVMLVARVLMKWSAGGNPMTELPPPQYDTTDNGKGTVFVKYEDDDFYPAYILHYEENYYYY